MSSFNQGGALTSVIKKRQKRSNFNLSHDVKMSLDMGNVIPCYLQEVIPGDVTKIHTSQMLRLAPLISPVMHKINVYIEFFFVPNRILWDGWEEYITGSKNGKQTPVDQLPAMPKVLPWNDGLMQTGPSTLMDYLGLPPSETFASGEEPSFLTAVNALPFAAYHRIWDEYYRDQNLQDSIYDVGEFKNYNKLFDGLQPDDEMQLLSGINARNWQHDYFTSCLPFAQKGDPVTIPIDIQALQDPAQIKSSDTGLPITGNLNADSGTGFLNNGAEYAYVDQNFENTTTINDLRAAMQLQAWLETNARGGSRYFESIYAHFGLKSPDSRLDRPEFIGSHRSNMIISEVLQTSSPQGENDTPQGTQSGHGQNVSQSRNFKHYAQEHGYIMGMISVLPRTAYMQGIDRHWNKYLSRFDYYYPEFAHIGEQEVRNIEIYAGGNASEATETFGYMPRYAEYKFANSRVSGDFRDTLKYWHMARDFGSKPNLNASFIAADPSKRIFAVQDLPDSGDGDNPIRNYDSIYAHVYHDVKCSRLMPKYGKPSSF